MKGNFMGDHTVKNLEKIQQIMENGNYEEARPLIKKYLESNPNDPVAIRFHGNTYAYTGFLGRAKKIWRDGLKLFPDNVDLLYNYALAHYLQGNLYYAKKFWKKALKISPQDAEILFNLGQVARDEGKLKRAISYWVKALKLKSDNVELMKNYALAHFNLANALFEKGEMAQARQHGELAAKLDPASHMEPVSALLKKIEEHEPGKH
jgi:tetratricopeptide (TPR) repeat protein